jgi:hypothetical protein
MSQTAHQTTIERAAATRVIEHEKMLTLEAAPRRVLPGQGLAPEATREEWAQAQERSGERALVARTREWDEVALIAHSIERRRVLTEEDLTAYRERQNEPTAPLSIRAIHTRHHQLARYVAQGLKPQLISKITGHSPQRIRQYIASPDFQDLIAHYGSMLDDALVDVQKRLATLGVASLDELMERLEEDPKQFSNGALVEIFKQAFDRSVAPSKTSAGAQQNAAGGGARVGVQLNVRFVAAQAHGEGPQADVTTLDAQIVEGAEG